MNKYKEVVFKLRDEILSLRKFAYPEIAGPQATEILPLLINIRYNSIDTACSILQGAVELTERFTTPDMREKLEQILLESTIGLIERNSIREFLDKNDLVTDTAKKLFALSDEIADLNLQKSLSHLTETVYIAQGQLDAESIHLFLESYGFPNIVLQESAGVVLALTVGTLGKAEIRVAFDDADQARTYIRAMKAGVFMLSDLEEVHLQNVFPEEVEGYNDLSDEF